MKNKLLLIALSAVFTNQTMPSSIPAKAAAGIVVGWIAYYYRPVGDEDLADCCEVIRFRASSGVSTKREVPSECPEEQCKKIYKKFMANNPLTAGPKLRAFTNRRRLRGFTNRR